MRTALVVLVGVALTFSLNVTPGWAGLGGDAEIAGTVVNLGEQEVTLFRRGAYVHVPRDLVDEKADLRPGSEIVVHAKTADLARIRVVKVPAGSSRRKR
jgi:hypothetical protein